MKVGIVGLGKLGLPVAVAMAHRGVDVIGYDVDERRMSKSSYPHQETGPNGKEPFHPYLESADRLQFGTLKQVVNESDIIFVAVQTPHDERFEGTKPLVDEPVDFDYKWLVSAVRNIVWEKASTKPVPLVVISTVLPGTMQREIIPQLKASLPLVYNPFFIAMGTVMRDFLNPEFVLLGVEDEEAATLVAAFYKRMHDAPICRMSIPSAELTKVAYNTIISTKIAIANSLMEICHKTPGANVDDVTGALKCATKRIVSGAYMDGGMGDGGGCHPRDNIAMMWLGEQLNLSYNPSEHAMVGREKQSAWLRDLVMRQVIEKHLPVVIAGYAFKPGTDITTGSPALLLAEQLKARGVAVRFFDPHVDPNQGWFPLTAWVDGHGDAAPMCVVIGCRHPQFEGWDPNETLAPGSVVIDPHRITKRSDGGVQVIHVGVGLEAPRVIERHVVDGMAMADR